MRVRVLLEVPVFRAFGITVALLVLCPAASLGAGLAFRDERTISVKLADKDRLAPVSVCNTGSKPLKRVAITVKGLGFADAEGGALPDTRVIVATTVQQPTPPRVGPLLAGPFPAGHCRTVILRRARAHGNPAAGTYDGIVAAVANGGGLARRRLRVTVASTEKTPTPTTPLSPDVHLVAHTDGPFVWGDAHLDDDQTIVLVREVKPDLPEGCTPSKAAPPACFVGNLAHDTDVASVYAAGAPQAVPAEAGGRAHAWSVKLHIVGAGDPGDYKGTLDFGPGGKDSKPQVNLTVAVGDHKIWPILFVLIVQAFGVGALWWRRRHTPHHAIKKTLGGFRADYITAAEAFHAPGGPGRHLIRPTEPEIEAHVATIRAAVEAYDDSTLLYDPSSAAYKAILASIDEVNADIASWQSTLGPTMDALHAAVTATVDACPDRTPRDVPALVTAATALMAHTRLAVGEAVAREAKANQLVAALATLRSLLTDLRHGLDTLIKVPYYDLDPVDQRRFERASALLDGAHWRLWHATTAEQLDAATTSERISAAQLVLDELGHEASPPPARVYAVAQGLHLRVSPNFVLERLGDVVDSLPAFVGDLIDRAEAAVGRAARSAVLRKASSKLLETIVFLVTATAALVAVVAALSIGDTFGSPWDYLKLVAASVSGPVVGAGALAAVGRLRALRSDPLLRAEAEPASVEA